MSVSRRGFIELSLASALFTTLPKALADTQKAPLKNKDGNAFRDYDQAPEHVRRFYEEHHKKQTYNFAKNKLDEYSLLNHGKASAWQMMERLNNVVDDSDPDISLSQFEHAYQAAEAIKRDGHPEWMQVTGFIHDMGKALIFWGEPQWAVVGDTYPTGLRFSESITYAKYLQNNPDVHNPAFESDYGIYKPGIGLDNVVMSWGHDEYLYQVLKSQSHLPEEALFLIRYHSLYPLHTAEDKRYLALMNDKDKQLFKWLKAFNKYDLYSKSGETYSNNKKLQTHYKDLIAQYIPGTINW